MGIVYEDEINGHDSVYFSVDRTGGIQYNTNVRFLRVKKPRRHFADKRAAASAMA